MHRRLAILGSTALALCGPAAVCTPSEGQTTESTESISAIYDRLAFSLARLSSVEYEAQRTVTTHLPLPPDSPMSPVMRSELYYAIQGNRAFSRIDDLDPEAGAARSAEGAYDGRRYQRLSSGALQVQSDRPDSFPGQFHAIQPIAMPFAFVFEVDDDIQYSTLHNEGIWQRLASNSRYIGVERVGDRLCDVILVERRNPKFNAMFSYQVFLDRELDYYPVRWELDATPLPGPDGSIAGATTRTVGMAQPQAYDTTVGRVIIPMQVTVDIFFEGTLGRTIETSIDPGTLRINEPIDESLFTIDESLASRGVLDRDTRTITRPAEQPLERTWKWYLVMALPLLLIIVALLVWRRAR